MTVRREGDGLGVIDSGQGRAGEGSKVIDSEEGRGGTRGDSEWGGKWRDQG